MRLGANRDEGCGEMAYLAFDAVCSKWQTLLLHFFEFTINKMTESDKGKTFCYRLQYFGFFIGFVIGLFIIYCSVKFYSLYPDRYIYGFFWASNIACVPACLFCAKKINHHFGDEHKKPVCGELYKLIFSGKHESTSQVIIFYFYSFALFEMHFACGMLMSIVFGFAF